MKKLIIFDLDGTLLDTSAGIIACYNQTALDFGLQSRRKRYFKGIIGNSLLNGFKLVFNMDEKTAHKAVKHFRALYAEKGIHLFSHYPGTARLLADIKSSGSDIAVATLKHESFAVKMLEAAGFSGYIGAVFGDNDAGLTKTQLLQKAMDFYNAAPEETILVGDSVNDVLGAEEAGIDFIGVTYGLGFTGREDIVSGHHIAAAESAEEIFLFLSK